MTTIKLICPMFGAFLTYHMERTINWEPSVGDSIVVIPELVTEVKYRRYTPNSNTLQVELSAIQLMNGQDSANKTIKELAKKCREGGWTVTEFNRS